MSKLSCTLGLTCLSLIAWGCDSAGITEPPVGILLSASAGQAAELQPAFAFFPGTGYDTPFTHSYADAHGTVAVPNGSGSDPACLIVAVGLKASSEYTVYLDLNGSTPGDVATAGPWVAIGSFTTNRGGNGSFRCSQPPPSASSVYINETAAGLTVLISGNLP